METPVTDAEKIAPYLADLRELFASGGLDSISGFDHYVFVAQGLHESGFTWGAGYSPKGDPHGTGDAGHGHGLYQIDDRTYGDWLGSAHWWEPRVNMSKALSILRCDRNYFSSMAYMPGVPSPTFLRLVLAAYNCGPTAARKGLLLHDDPDHSTARGNYSAWILAKAAELRGSI